MNLGKSQNPTPAAANWRLPYRRTLACEHLPEPGEGTDVLVVSNLSVSYPSQVTPAVSNVSFSLTSGTHTALTGPNGAGKSTVLKAAAGLLRPTDGTVTVFGCPAVHCHPATCYLPQRSQVDWEFPITVLGLVLTGAYVRLGWLRRPGTEEVLQARQALHRLRLEQLADRQISQLSGGQQQRALLARAMVHNARLYLLDEPFNGIDQGTLEILDEVLVGLAAEGRTLLTSTHHTEHLSVAFDTVLEMENGHLARLESEPR